MKSYGIRKLRIIKQQLLSGEISEGVIPFGKGKDRVKENSLRTSAASIKLMVKKKEEREVYLITKKKEDENNSNL